MAHFAKIGLKGKVIEVLSVHNNELLDADGEEQEVNGVDFLTKLTGWAVWKQTSYNANFRKNFASIGMTYDEDRDAFISPKPYPSWVLNESICQWEAPVAIPSRDGLDVTQVFIWNEEIGDWDITPNIS